MTGEKITTIGSKVKISLNGKIKELEIVGSADVDVKNGKVSYLSPIGEAVLGRQVGEQFEFALPDGKRVSGQILSLQ